MPVETPTTSSFSERFAQIIKACHMSRSVRACLLATRDREHALNVVKESICQLSFSLYQFSVAERRRFHREELRWEIIGGETPDPAVLLRSAAELRGGGVVVLEDCAAFLRDDGGDRRMRMALSQMLACESPRDGLTLVFLEPPEAERYLPSILADQFVRLDIPYPRAEELETIAREEVAFSVRQAGRPLDVALIRSEAGKLASGLSGLTRSAARDALRDALAPNPVDFRQAMERLQKRKSEQLRRELAMNILDTSEVEIPIGLDNLMRFLQIYRNKMRVSGPGRARGILLVGPPGTGKTMLARAIGAIAGLPVVEFQISSLMNSLLGETERRFAQAFATLEAMSPNVVFIDEIDKAFGDSSERDGGTMKRCTGGLLSWLNDNPYPNFVVGTCNNLASMGEIGLTMTRSGRFNACFFVDVPTAESRVEMLKRWLTGQLEEVENAAVELAELTERFSGADLQSAVEQAVACAQYEGKPLSISILRAGMECKKRRAYALYDEFNRLRQWGQMFCEPAGPMNQQHR